MTTELEQHASAQRAVEPQLRPAAGADLEAVSALLTASDLPVDGVAEQFGERYAVAWEGDRLVGVAGVEVYGEWGLLRSAAVAPDRRGVGLGEALVRDRVGWARGRGLRGLYLLTTTAPDFFTRYGFERIARDDVPEPVRRSSEFASICPDSAIVMKLSLERELRDEVREKYGQAALRVVSGQGGNGCCGSGCGCSSTGADPITRDLYDAVQVDSLPEQAVLASLGCGNPTALAELKQGEVVLDLGSGGGIDVLLSAKRVGPTGKAYGLDMTDEMLALARSNQQQAGATNVEFLKGEIENIPLGDASVDVIISNCVINLSADKPRVLAEAFRVLRPGGRFAVSDVVVRGDVPAEMRRNVELWIGCVAGALEEEKYRTLLADAGFVDIDLEPTRIYTREDARELLAGTGLDASLADAADGAFMSAFVRARKPE